MASNSSIVLDIGAKVDKTWQAAMTNIGTDLNKLGRLIHNNMKMFDDSKKSISNYIEEINKLKEKINSTLTEAKSKNFVNQKEISSTQGKITRAQKSGKDTSDLEAQLASLKSFENLKIDSPLRAKILGIMNNISDLENKMHEAELNMENVPKNIAHAFKQYIGNVALSTVQSIINALGQLGRTGIKVLGNLVGVFGKTVEKAIGLEKAIKLIIQYGFGFRSLYYLVRRLRTGIEAGFEYLGGAITSSRRAVSGFSKEVGNLLNTLKELMYYLKSASAAMLQPFMPLIEWVIPKLVAWFNALAIAVANFIATLTGQSKIYVASTNLEDYANALDQVAGSATKAKEALGAYDKLNVIPHNNSGGGGANLDTSGWFTEQPVEPSRLAELIKEAWEKADFTEVGLVIGSKFKEILEGINWDDKVFPMIEKIAKSIGTFMNGFTSVEGLGAEIGKTIANIFNGITLYVETLASTLDWGNIGKFIVDGINRFLETFDAAQAGRALHKFAEGMLTMLGNIFASGDGIDSRKLGEDVGTFFENLNIPDLAIKLYNVAKQFVLGFADALMSWAETDPESFGIAAAITASMAGLNIASGLGGLLLKLGTAGVIDFSQLFGDIGSNLQIWLAKTIMSAFSGETLLSQIIIAISDLISNIATFLSGAIGPILLVVGAGLIGEIANSWDSGKSTLENILVGLGNAWHNLYYNIIEPIVELIKSIVVPIWNAIKEVFINVGGALASNLVPICQTLASVLSGSVLPIIKKLFEFLKVVWSFLEPIITTLITLIGDILTVVLDVTAAILKTLTPFIQMIINALGQVITWLSNILVNTLNTVSQKWSAFWEGLKSVVRTVGNVLIGFLNKILSGVGRLVNGIVDGLNSIRINPPGWVTALTGIQSFGFNLSHVSVPQIPYLAQGAVIPPNRQFLAMLGDQTSGTNIEAPLDTIKQALVEALSESANTSSIVLQLDGRTIAKAVWDENEKRYKQLGKYAY